MDYKCRVKVADEGKNFLFRGENFVSPFEIIIFKKQIPQIKTLFRQKGITKVSYMNIK